MTKIIICAALFVASFTSFSQVGIGTLNPKATLDVVGDPSTATAVDGISLPKLTADQLAAKTGYGQDQNGAMVYVTAVPSTTLTGEFINVTNKGIYVYTHDGTSGLWTAVDRGKWTNLDGNSISSFTENTATQQVKVDLSATSGNQELILSPKRMVMSSEDPNTGLSTISFDLKGTGSGASPQTFRRHSSIESNVATAEGNQKTTNYIQFRASTRNAATTFSDNNYLGEMTLSSNSNDGNSSLTINPSNQTISINHPFPDPNKDYVSPFGFNHSYKKGVMPPRLKSVELSNLPNLTSSHEGLYAYCLDCSPKGLFFYNGNGFVHTSSSTGLSGLMVSVILDFINTEVGSTVDAIITYFENGAGAETISSRTTQFYISDDAQGTNRTQVGTAGDTSYTIVSGNINKWLSYDISVTASNGETTRYTSSYIPLQITFNSLTYIPIRGTYDNNGDGIGDYIWLDRNLGASQKATVINDANSFGDYYQWGRDADGHEGHASSTSPGPVAAGSEGSDFITVNNATDYWLTMPDFLLWRNLTDSSNGVDSNPCPSGFRVPRISKFRHELSLFPTNDMNGGFNSVLVLPENKGRKHDGSLLTGGGFYWSSDSYANGIPYTFLLWGVNTSTTNQSRGHAWGAAVRCIMPD